MPTKKKEEPIYYRADLYKKALKRGRDLKKQLEEVRTAVADYISTEGCTCCQDYEGHKQAMNRLGEALNLPKYPDGSGYDIYQFRSKKS